MCAMEETSDTLTLAAEERAKQGIHELEISFGGELDLHKHFHLCKKNPRHLKFIPVNIFKQHHLPKHRHSHKILAWVRQISDFTVKLSVNYVSPNRPSGYPLSDRAGQRVLSVGSGFVTDISLTENNDKLPCPLKNCGHRPGYHVVCGYITIVTAAHVVFDDEEAQNTTVEFFYDDSSDRSSVMKASGVRVAVSSVEGDFCELLCVTHERNLFWRLQYKLMCAKKEASDTLTLAAEERAEQLIQELEISFHGELDIHRHFDNYLKNAGHPDFIPVHKLEEWHVLKYYYSHKIPEYVKQVSDLNAKVYVNYVSPNRPSGYPLSDRAGQRVLSVGSGFVTDSWITENNDQLPCPRKNCDHRPERHVVCGYITIVTAKHVVFDDEEAQNTIVHFFSDDSSDRSGVMIASGVRVAASSVEGDFCELLCVTHETNLFEILKRKLMYANEETSDTLTLAAEERAKQLKLELKFNLRRELDLHKHFDNYSKNPRYLDSIPVSKLEEMHFHQHYYSHKIAEYVRQISDLTVNVYVHYVSPNRPSGYPLSDRAGQQVLAVGSGFVADISLTKNIDKLKCPLKNCGHRPDCHMVRGYITIVTAAHVVFDDEEAEKTTVEIVFDSLFGECLVMKANGVRVAASSVEGDFCALLCVTHETKFFERLKYEFILRTKNKEICQIFRTLLPGLESIQYEPGACSQFFVKISLSNPSEAVKALIVLKVFTEDVIDHVLENWNPGNNSLSDVLECTSFNKEDILALMKFGKCILEGIHRDKPPPSYVSELRNLNSRSYGNNNIKSTVNCQEAILSLISELGKDCSTQDSLETALSLWDSSGCRDFLNIHKVMDISNGIATIKVILSTKYAKYASDYSESDPDDSESKPDDMFLVHIGHPHGQSKHVTIGRQTDCFTGDGFYHQLYTAPTCPGCSGGPVWMIPASGDLSEVYGVPHSGCHGNQLNRGCSWTVYPLKKTYYDY